MHTDAQIFGQHVTAADQQGDAGFRRSAGVFAFDRATSTTPTTSAVVDVVAAEIGEFHIVGRYVVPREEGADELVGHRARLRNRDCLAFEVLGFGDVAAYLKMPCGRPGH